MATDGKQLFRNTTSGWLGVITIDRRGERHPIAVAPGDTVWLSPEEQEVTAMAPRLPANNPFVAQPFKEFDSTGELLEEGSRPQLVLETQERPTPATRRPIGDAPQGEFAEGEEVGTPVAFASGA
jgi:hypothetical protein